MCLAGEGEFVVSGGDDGHVHLWSISSVLESASRRALKPDPVRSWTEHTLAISQVASGLGGASGRVYTASQDRTVKVWHLHRGTLLASVLFPSQILSLALDPAETKIFAGGGDGRVFVVDTLAPTPTSGVTSFAVVNSIAAHTRGVVSLAVAVDGSTLVSGSADGAKVWDISSGQALRSFSQHKGGVSGVICLDRPAILDAVASRRAPGFLGVAPLKRFPDLEAEQGRGTMLGATCLPVGAWHTTGVGFTTTPMDDLMQEHQQIMVQLHEDQRGERAGLAERVATLEAEKTQWQRAAQELHHAALQAVLHDQ
eukprot:CAMPEP_0175931928 /NCGR_PEP_ID=MMETSP0108-20121206/19114_1 /TAXON_ID=195067 ORGANISM="Goniomonas pacifica, Strain CCMP1869" /NCGR_SAMPLE_ID=MMETSP0108 /ASSEMBLY_ACC=CAM_ASM_000204 /LENGTH=311 /DNA_ID=CAMNT_0017255525 /DNA_START=76 /DNA_END=1011 /DNA_ORIENTATION=-